MKKAKLYVRITLFVVLAAAIGIAAVTFISSNNILKIMKKTATEQLTGVVESKSTLIGEYIAREFTYLDAYMISDSMQALMEDSNNPDPEVVARAQATTESIATIIPNVDSVLFTAYEGTCLVHNVPAMVGFRNPDEIIEMLNSYYYSPDGTPLYSAMALLSPATNEISLCMAKSGYTSSKQPSGYVSVTVSSAELNGMLSDIKVTNNQEIMLLSTSDGSIIYNTDPSLITTTIESGPAFSLYEKITNGEEVTSGTLDYTSDKTGKQMLGSYITLPQYGWLLFVGADASELYSQAKAAQSSILLVGVIVLVAIAVVLAIIINILTKPLTRVQNALTKVSNYDLNTGREIEDLEKRGDEIGKLAVATKEVIRMLSDVVGILRNCSSSLTQSSRDLEQTSDKLVSVTSENAHVADALSGSIDTTNVSIESVNEEINKIVGLVGTVSEKVSEGRKDSDELIASASDLSEKIDKEVETNVSTLDETVESMQEALKSLEAVEKINELADAIMQITSQTNLLSLNASIEAARAGEAGRGFAVVAGEIAALADQSKNTALNIQEIVEESNRSVVNVRDQVNKLIELVKTDVIDTFGNFAEQSKHFNTGIATIQEAVNAIGNAMDALNSSVDEIAREITAVNSASSENSSGVAEIIQKNEQTSDVTRNIEDLAKNSKENAESLDRVVNKFEVR
ncbi:MAG: methyl-accepting chemotaxis protein [Lachnospiraceae bacterium]|nr:methyl-accepting chemotaxis protein [Lachnospiraceae bacterium]